MDQKVKKIKNGPIRLRNFVGFSLFLFPLLIFNFSCVPKEDEKKDQGTCGTGKTFDPATRSCSVVDLPPTGILNSLSMAEDASKTVVLAYTDIDNDLATSCQIVSYSAHFSSLSSCTCIGGTCTTTITPEPDAFGNGEFYYRLQDKDGFSSSKLVGVQIINQDDIPVNTGITPNTGGSFTGTSVNEDATITYTLLYTDVDTDLATACQIPTKDGDIAVTSPCSCLAGVCTVGIGGTSNINGAGKQFTYQVQANGQWSAASTVTFNINSVADNPQTTLGSVTIDQNTTNPVAEDFAPAKFQLDGTDGDGDALTDCIVDDPTNLTNMTVVGGGGAGCTCVASVCTADFTSIVADGNVALGTLFSFRYMLQDATSAWGSWSEIIPVTVAAVNDAPTISDPGATAINEDTVTTLTFTIDEGGGTDEDAQSISLLVWSDNTTILPHANISVKYNSTVIGTGDTITAIALGDSTNSANLQNMELVLTPVSNQTGGPFNINIRAIDSSGSATDTTNLTVALTYNETNDSPSIRVRPNSCVYNTQAEAASCSTSGCIAYVTPVGALVPNNTGQLYYDAYASTCYISNGLTNADWTTMNTECPITKSTVETNCSGLHCAAATDPTTASITPVAIGSYFLDWVTKSCYISTGTSSASDWSLTTPNYTAEVIPDQTVNEKETLVIKAIEVDEGGDATEDADDLTIQVDTSNALVLANGGIQVYYNDVLQGIGGVALNGWDPGDSAANDLKLALTPLGPGKTTITVTITDDDGFGAGANPLVTTDTFDLIVYPVGATHGGWSSIKAVGDHVDNDGTTTSNGYVVLDWNSFTMIGGTDTSSPLLDTTFGSDYSTTTISGWNVYRRQANEDFDYTKPLNSSVIALATTTYTDSSTNTNVDPGPPSANLANTQGRVYYYQVKAVDSTHGLNTTTPEVFSTVRVVYPPKNKVFVHRWMANQNVCSLMHKSTSASTNPSDPTKNYRCPFNGPGELDDGGTKYYDLAVDLLVDRFEAGCPYSTASATSDCGANGCIGIGSPSGSINGAANLVYYDRSSGICYISAGASVWNAVNTAAGMAALTATMADSSNTGHLPPLTNIIQPNANTLCTTRNNITLWTARASSVNLDVKHIPSRKQQIAYSAWDNSADPTTTNSLETGLSMSTTNTKCNASSANGLTSGYTDTSLPFSSQMYSLPGTQSSLIRSVRTGSDVTASCSSQFAVQDAVGNVREWAADRIHCTSAFLCNGVTTALANATQLEYSGGNVITDDFDVDDGVLFNFYTFDGQVGPCVDIDSNGSCDTNLSIWSLSNESYSAGHFTVPLALPIDSTFLTNNPASLTISDLLSIGPSSGFLNTQLHNDDVSVETSTAFADDDNCAGMTTGGAYTSGDGAGRYNMEYYKCDDNNSDGDVATSTIGFRCVHPLIQTTYGAYPAMNDPYVSDPSDLP